MAIYGESEEEAALRGEEHFPVTRPKRRTKVGASSTDSSRQFADAAIAKQTARDADARAKLMPKVPFSSNPVTKMFTGARVAEGLELKLAMRGKGGMLSLTRKF